jgi:polo-like kinase 1
LKKWVRTKHAILFRLSNQTVQVVFYDHTEILLTSEARIVTFVNKRRERETYMLDDVMAASDHADIKKRLKYAEGILSQLCVSSPKK